MPVNLPPLDPAQLHAVAGVRWGITEAGVRKANRKDVSVMLLDAGASVAGVFTKNRFCAAPVQVCREHLAARMNSPLESDEGVPVADLVHWCHPSAELVAMSRESTWNTI